MWAYAGLAVGAAAALYTMVFYPAFLALARRRTAPPVRKDMGFRATVSTVLAVHDGERYIGAKLESLLALRYPAELLDITVVSDGSTDGTDGIVESFASRGVRLLRVPHAGKPAAINAGVQQATGEILFFTDVRQPLDADALAHLVANFADPSVGAATGELRILGADAIGVQRDLGVYWRYELWARERHSEIDSVFSVTGCIYAMRRSLASPLPTDALTDDAVMSQRVFFRGYRVIFDPQAIAYDYPMAGTTEFRRRLRTLAGLWQVCIRMPELFTGANRMRLDFLSHKFSRLALPWAVLLAGTATLALDASPLKDLLVNGAAILAILALVDRWVPRRYALKRVTSPARTFLAMNAAALLSVVVFFVRPSTLWRTTRVKVVR
jgi:cellulose synthase/poly-beta-1,6-N-acetylglucosamine synthase-like glycosyltransferase